MFNYSNTEVTDSDWLIISYPVLQREDRGLVDVELDRDFGFAGADVAVGDGRVQDARHQQLLPEVGTFVQEDLQEEGKRTFKATRAGRKGFWNVESERGREGFLNSLRH